MPEEPTFRTPVVLLDNKIDESRRRKTEPVLFVRIRGFGVDD